MSRPCVFRTTSNATSCTQTAGSATSRLWPPRARSASLCSTTRVESPRPPRACRVVWARLIPITARLVVSRLRHLLACQGHMVRMGRACRWAEVGQARLLTHNKTIQAAHSVPTHVSLVALFCRGFLDTVARQSSHAISRSGSHGSHGSQGALI